MAASSIAGAFNDTRLEDVLAHLPISATTEYRKGQAIYDQNNPSKGIYLVVSGKVEISQIGAKGKQLLLEIIKPDELFGESALLDVRCHPEQAVAFENANVMAWGISDLEDLVVKRPRLALALLQIIVQRNVQFANRIESCSMESIPLRLTRAIIHFSGRLGTQATDGSMAMMPFTHETLARYIGTSREIITHHMNVFRKQGFVSYSRRGMVVNRDAMRASIN